MTAECPRGMVALGLVALLVLLGACTREPAAPQPPPLTLPSGPSTSAARPPAMATGRPTIATTAAAATCPAWPTPPG